MIDKSCQFLPKKSHHSLRRQCLQDKRFINSSQYIRLWHSMNVLKLQALTSNPDADEDLTTWMLFQLEEVQD